jgi:trehalose 6-phosphate synthase
VTTPSPNASPSPVRFADLPVVLLSHRGPVSFGRDAASGERTTSRGAGGLVTALSGLAGHLTDAVWVCVAAGAEDAEVAREASGALRLALDGEPRVLSDGQPSDREVSVRLVDVPDEVHTPFYGVIANPLLWFVQHRLHDLKSSPSIGREERAAFEDGYVAANALAADAVVEQVERVGGQALVLLHDYHFYLVGESVRARCPGALISHFVHIPGRGRTPGRSCRRTCASACCSACSAATSSPSTPAPTPAPSCSARRSCWTCRSTCPA